MEALEWNEMSQSLPAQVQIETARPAPSLFSTIEVNVPDVVVI